MEKKKDEWLDFIKNDFICAAYSYASYSKYIQKLTGFGMKDCLSLPVLGWKFFNSLREEDNERFYTVY